MKEKIVSVLLILSFLILLAFPVPVFSGASAAALVPDSTSHIASLYDSF